MRGVETQSEVLAFSLALQGLAFGILFIFGALASVEIGGISLRAGFLPLMALYFWPRTASWSWSLIGASLLGLLYDIVVAGPLGLWALTLTIFTVLRGDFRPPHLTLNSSWAGFMIALVLGAFAYSVLGRVFTSTAPNWTALLTEFAVTALVFPLIYGLRRLLLLVRYGPADPLRTR